MKRLVQLFLRGLIVTVPLFLSAYVCWWIVSRVDRILDVGIPGAGIVVTLAGITLIGFLAGNLVTRGVVAEIEGLVEKLPFVRLLYSSTKDLLNAFVGEQRRFNRPVRAQLDDAGNVWILGFVTAEGSDRLGMPGFVAVYFPQSYNFAGNLIMVPANRVQPIAAESSEIMTFIVSGGVSGSAESKK